LPQFLFRIFLGKRLDLPLLVESLFFLLVLAPTVAGSLIGQPVPLLQEETKSRNSIRELYNNSGFNLSMKICF